jgi:hypothetical protein
MYHSFINHISLICKRLAAGCQWLTPVILATWEAEIRRIVVPGQTQEKSLRDPSQQKKLVYTCPLSYTRKHKIRGLRSRLAWTKSEIPPHHLN